MQNNLFYENIHKYEFDSLRRHGMLVGACLLVNYLLQNIIAFAMALFGVYDIYLENLSFQYAFNTLAFTGFCLGVPFLVMSLKKASPSYFRVLPFNAPAEKSKAFYYVCAGFAMCVFSNYIAGFFKIVLFGVGIEVETPDLIVSKNPGDSFMNFILTAFAAPLIEEFVFRGVVLQPLRRYGNGFAIVASTLLFALAHGSPSSVVFAFVAGLAMGWAAVATGSLWVSIGIHFLNNFYAVALSEVYTYFPELNAAWYNVLLLVIFGVGLAGAAALIATKQLGLPKVCCTLRGGEKVKAFFLNPTIILLMVYFAFSMLSFVSLSFLQFGGD